MSKQAIIYCRVSTKGQEDDGTSLDSQELACRQLAAARGYAVAGVTREVYTGAELWDRPKLAQVRADLKGGTFHAIIVYAIDRLSRDPIHLAIVAEECERAGVALEFVTEPLDSTPEGQLIAYVRGYAAKIEREKIRERNMRGRKSRALNGKVPGAGFDLYGYRKDRDTGLRVICEPEAAVIRDIFTWIGVEGLGISAVVRRLNERAVVPPSTGKVQFSDAARAPRWGTGTVGRFLRQSAYMGEAYAWRYQTRVPGRAAGSKARPREEWIRLPEHTTPAIVSPELWAAVQHRLETNHGEWTRNMNKARQYLLRGLVICAVCKRPMYAQPTRDIQVYRCSSRHAPEGKCGGSSVSASLLEPWVWQQVESVLRNPEIIAEEVRRRQGDGPDPVLASDLEHVRARLARIEKQQAGMGARLRDAVHDAVLWDLLTSELAKMEQERADLQTAVADIETRLAQHQDFKDRLEALSTYCERVRQNLATFGFEEKRLALEALAVRVTVNGRDWRIDGAIPLTDADVGVSSLQL